MHWIYQQYMLGLFIALFLETVLTLITTPVNNPICKGQLDSGPGGMFGYSLSLSSGTGPYTWMAIGKPWDCSVHVYVATNPNLADIFSYFAKLNGTAMNSTFSQSLPVPAPWKPVNMIGDTANGTYPMRGYSLFGYSVSLSEDGAWLVVGIPGRTYASLSSSILLQYHSYSGAARLYRRNDVNLISPLNPFNFIGEIPNPNTGSRFWDKFGNKVQIKTTNLKFSWSDSGYSSNAGNSNQRTYIFVVASSGWDGASVKFNSAMPGNPNWPIGPTTDVSRAGIYVYLLTNPAALSASGSIVAPGGLLKYLQFIPLVSNLPLGTVGIDFSLIEIPSVVNLGSSDLLLLMRDFVFPANSITQQFYNSNCPSGNCSYIVYQDTEGNTQQINSTGAVLEYILDPVTLKFSSTNNMMTAFPAAVVSNGNLVPVSVNKGYGTTEWERESWFGASISSAWDSKYQRLITSIGAPRDGMGVYTYFKDTSALTGEWDSGQYILNDQYSSRTSFGLRTSLSSDGKFLIVSDPSGSSSRNGHGQVFLYHRRSNNEYLVPSNLNNVPLARLPNQNDSTFPLPPYYFDKITEFASKNWDSIPVNPTLKTDHFGLGISHNPYFIVVGAPVEDCVYTFSHPLAMDVTLISPTVPVQPQMSTFTPVPTPVVVNSDTKKQTNPNQAWLYGLIAGLITLFLVLPIVWMLLKRRHKLKVLEKLKLEETMKKLEQEGGFLDGAVTRTGTIENVAGSNDYLGSSSTLGPNEIIRSTDSLN